MLGNGWLGFPNKRNHGTGAVFAVQETLKDLDSGLIGKGLQKFDLFFHDTHISLYSNI